MAATEWDKYMKSASKRRATIYQAYRDGAKPSFLAEEYGVTVGRIHQIIKAQKNGTRRKQGGKR